MQTLGTSRPFASQYTNGSLCNITSTLERSHRDHYVHRHPPAGGHISQSEHINCTYCMVALAPLRHPCLHPRREEICVNGGIPYRTRASYIIYPHSRSALAVRSFNALYTPLLSLGNFSQSIFFFGRFSQGGLGVFSSNLIPLRENVRVCSGETRTQNSQLDLPLYTLHRRRQIMFSRAHVTRTLGTQTLAVHNENLELPHREEARHPDYPKRHARWHLALLKRE